jgi:hypothetical protein
MNGITPVTSKSIPRIGRMRRADERAGMSVQVRANGGLDYHGQIRKRF